MQEIERFRLGDLLSFGDTLGERMLWHHRFDRLERVAAVRPCHGWGGLSVVARSRDSANGPAGKRLQNKCFTPRYAMRERAPASCAESCAEPLRPLSRKF